MYTWQTLIINSFPLIRYTSLEFSIHHFRHILSAIWNYYVKWNLLAIPITRCLFGQEEGLCLPKRQAYHEVLADFSVTSRKVLDGYEETSILKASGINILFYKNNWAAGCASISWAFYICCPPADCCLYYNILLSPTKNSPLPLKLHEAANRGRSDMLCVQWEPRQFP